jgi:hypothetical protein
MSETMYVDQKTQTVRDVNFFHYDGLSKSSQSLPLRRRRNLRHKDKLTEITVAFSFEKLANVLIHDIFEHFIDGLGDMTVNVYLGSAVKNPKDAPNRKVARRLARMRMKFKPTVEQYQVHGVTISGSVLRANLSRVKLPQDEPMPTEISLVLDKKTGKLRVYAKR